MFSSSVPRDVWEINCAADFRRGIEDPLSLGHFRPAKKRKKRLPCKLKLDTQKAQSGSASRIFVSMSGDCKSWAKIELRAQEEAYLIRHVEAAVIGQHKAHFCAPILVWLF